MRELIERMKGLADTPVPKNLIPRHVFVGIHADWYHGWEGKKERPISEIGIVAGMKQHFKRNPKNRADSVYVATSPGWAGVYAKLYSKPMILKVDTGKLNKAKFFYDDQDVQNQDGSPNQLAYRGSIPPKAISVYS